MENTWRSIKLSAVAAKSNEHKNHGLGERRLIVYSSSLYTRRQKDSCRVQA
jgi:hypothetical protein